MHTMKYSTNKLEGRDSQVFVGDLFAIEIVQKFGAIFVGIQDPHSTQMTVVEDGLAIRRSENRRVNVQRKHGWWFENAPQFVGVGTRGCGGLVVARRDVLARESGDDVEMTAGSLLWRGNRRRSLTGGRG